MKNREKMMENNKIIVVTGIKPEDNDSPLSLTEKLLKLCTRLFSNVTLYTSNYPPDYSRRFTDENLFLCDLSIKLPTKGIIQKLYAFVKLQLRIIRKLRKNSDRTAIVVFWIAGPMILLYLYCKLHKYQTIGFLYGNPALGSKKIIKRLSASLIKRIACGCTWTCVEAPAVALDWKLSGKRKNKTVHVISLYIDTDRFYPISDYCERPKTIGMCCRLIAEKKPLEAIEAFSLFIKRRPEWKMEIAGD